MLMYFLLFQILFLSSIKCFQIDRGYLREIFVDTPKNHFDFTSYDTFKLRVLINNEFYNDNNGAVFVYCGNEGDIYGFYNNSGFILELAQEFGALVVFIEHRYFGKSIPDPNSFQFFSVEQVLEDFVFSLIYLRDNIFHWKESSTPIISFGGSYGGMLASWGKIRYPSFYTGALASSAPNLHFEGLVDPGLFAKIVTESFSQYGCDKNTIQPVLKLLDQSINDPKTYSNLESVFRTCKSVKSLEDAKKIYEVVFLSLQNLAVANYPTPSEFFQPLPSFPVKIACEKFLDKTPNLESLFEIVNVYFNNSSCLDLEELTKNDIYYSYNWHFGRCSQMILPMEYNGVTDFFYPPRLWNLQNFLNECNSKFPNNLRPVPTWIPERLNSFNKDGFLIGAENIIFSNGSEDPWSSGGIYSKHLKFSPTCTSIVIKGAAHHEDLRSSDSLKDPKSLTEARNTEKLIISKWINNKKKQK